MRVDLAVCRGEGLAVLLIEGIGRGFALGVESGLECHHLRGEIQSLGLELGGHPLVEDVCHAGLPLDRDIGHAAAVVGLDLFHRPVVVPRHAVHLRIFRRGGLSFHFRQVDPHAASSSRSAGVAM